MANKYKSLSHIERMNNPAYKPKVELPNHECYEFVRTQEVNKETGRICYKTKKKLVEKNRFEKFKVTDFCLENLQAIGAIDKLNSVTLKPDVHTAITSVENSLYNLSQSITKEN